MLPKGSPTGRRYTDDHTASPARTGGCVVKGLARRLELPAPWPKAKCVDAGPCIAQGGYSPVTGEILTGPVQPTLGREREAAMERPLRIPLVAGNGSRSQGAGRTKPVGHPESPACRGSPSDTRRLDGSSTMGQRQVSAAFRSLACQSRTSVPTRSRRSTFPATQVVRKRTLLGLGATHWGGSPPTSSQGRSSRPDETSHPGRSAARAARPTSRDPPRLPRDRHRPLADRRTGARKLTLRRRCQSTAAVWRG